MFQKTWCSRIQKIPQNKFGSKNHLIKGLVGAYVENGVAILQYANDTISCIQDDKNQVAHLKLLLYIYENRSGLKINFAKSDVMIVSQNSLTEWTLSHMFNFAIGK